MDFFCYMIHAEIFDFISQQNEKVNGKLQILLPTKRKVRNQKYF